MEYFQKIYENHGSYQDVPSINFESSFHYYNLPEIVIWSMVHPIYIQMTCPHTVTTSNNRHENDADQRILWGNVISNEISVH